MRKWVAERPNVMRVGASVAALGLVGVFAARMTSADPAKGTPFKELEARIDACCGGGGGLGAVEIVSGVSACDPTRIKGFGVTCPAGQVALGGGYQVEPCDGSGVFEENFAAASDGPIDSGSGTGWQVTVWDVLAKINSQPASSLAWRVNVRVSCVSG